MKSTTITLILRLRSVLVYFLFVVPGFTIAQTKSSLTIDQCYNLAKNNYPLIKQLELLTKANAYSIENASKAYLPQVGINGQATYQSDVTQLPIALPNIKIPELSKDQYKLYADVNQTIFDGGVTKQQKLLIETNSTIEKEQIETELYKLKERINQLFFGILLVDAQNQQNELLKKDIQSGIKKTEAAIANGTALKSNADILVAELLKANQHTIELNTTRKGYMNMLSLFINQSLDEKTALEKPQPKNGLIVINRNELKVFDLQKGAIDVQTKMIAAKNSPKLGIMIQAGYGRPTLNMLNDKFDFYYFGGIKLNWALYSYYTFKKDRQLLAINQDLLDVQKNIFLLTTNITLAQQNSEMVKVEELLKVDAELISLRERIKVAANAQLENGTITVTDYLTQVNAEDQAKQNLLLHQVQLLLTQYNYQTTSGN